MLGLLDEMVAFHIFFILPESTLNYDLCKSSANGLAGYTYWYSLDGSNFIWVGYGPDPGWPLTATSTARSCHDSYGYKAKASLRGIGGGLWGKEAIKED